MPVTIEAYVPQAAAGTKGGQWSTGACHALPPAHRPPAVVGARERGVGAFRVARGAHGHRGRGGSNGRPAASSTFGAGPSLKEAPVAARNAIQFPAHIYRLPTTWVNPVLPALRPDAGDVLARIRQHQAEREARASETAAEQRRYFLDDPSDSSAFAGQRVDYEEENSKDDELALDVPPWGCSATTLSSSSSCSSASCSTSSSSSSSFSSFSSSSSSLSSSSSSSPAVRAEDARLLPKPEDVPLAIYLRKVDEIDGRIRLRGNTRTGVSCSVFVRDFEPYFIIAMPDSFTRAHIAIFSSRLRDTAYRIKRECVDKGARVPPGLFPVPLCVYDTGTSAFTWLPRKLRGIKVMCPSIAAWRLYAELLTDGREAAYQQELEDLFRKRDADEAAAKAHKKANTLAARAAKVDRQQPSVSAWSFVNEKARYKGQPHDHLDSADEPEDDDAETARREAGHAAVGSVNHEDIAEEAIAVDDQPTTFNRNARKHSWNGIQMYDTDGVDPYETLLDLDGKLHDSFLYKFEVHNNGWKMPVVFLTLAGLHTKAWVNVMDPTLIEAEEQRLTTTQVELECSVKQLVYDPSRNEERDHSFQLTTDIECLRAKDNHAFPVATNVGDLVNVTTVKIDQPGALVAKPPVRIAFCLGTAIPSLLPHIQYVLLYDDESRLLNELKDLIVAVHPDNLVTYNGISFDAVYLLDRGETLQLDGFNQWSDIRGRPCVTRQVIRQAKQFGKEVFRMTDIPGTSQLDVMRIVPKMYKLDQYTLKFVAAHLNKKGEGRKALRERLYHIATHPDVPYVDPKTFVDEELTDPVEDPDGEGVDNDVFWKHEAESQLLRIAQWNNVVTQEQYDAWEKEITSKIDLPPHKLRPYFLAGPRSRTEIVRYCMRDTDVTHKIERDNILEQSAEAMSRLTNTDVDDLLTKGEQLKVWNKYCRIAHVDKWHLNRAFLRRIMPAHRLLERFKGGKVQEPLIGLYYTPQMLEHLDEVEPIATLDFNSLYPSINVNENNCTSSLIAATPANVVDAPPEVLEAHRMKQVVRVTQLDTGERVYTNQSCKTILPTMNRELLAQRKATRKRQKGYPKSSSVYEALECKQLAEKLVNNTTFGFSGAPRGFAGCPLVAAVTTAIGRNYITRTASMAAGPPYNHTVIYGDSVVGDTVLLVRDSLSGHVYLRRIDELVEDQKQWEAYRGPSPHGKEAARLPRPIDVWSDGGFTRIQCVIRHRFEQDALLRVTTASGVVDVTPHHSLLRKNLEIVKPQELKVGDELLHASTRTWAESVQAAAAGHDGATPLSRTVTTLMPNSTQEAWMWGVFLRHGQCGSRHAGPGQTDVWWHVTAELSVLQQVAQSVSFATTLEQHDSRTSLVLAPQDGGRGVGPTVWAFHALFYNAHEEKRVPPGMLTAPRRDLVDAFFDGYNAEQHVLYRHARANGQCWRLPPVQSKELCAGLWLLAERMACWPQLRIKVDIHSGLALHMLQADEQQELQANGKRAEHAPVLQGTAASHKVKCVRPLPVDPLGTVVYDLQTSNHHFGVAPGHLVVHNTDSIMIKMHRMDLGAEERTGDKERDFRALMIKHQEKATIVAKAASAMFQNPERPDLTGVINLDMEKLYCPYLLLGAKNYAGVKYEAGTPDYTQLDTVKRYEKTFLDPTFDPKLDMKGMAAVRRSACPIVRKLCTDMLSALMLFQDRVLALTLLSKALTQLAAGQMPMAMLVRTAKLAGKYEKDKKYPAHKIVADKLHAAASGDAPAIGSRVPFVFALNGASAEDQNLRAEHPRTVLERGYALDLEYYVEKQLHNPVVTFLEWFVRDPDVLFEQARAHIFHSTRSIVGGGVGAAIASLQKHAQLWQARDVPPVGGWRTLRLHYDEPSEPEEQDRWAADRGVAMEEERCGSPLPDVPFATGPIGEPAEATTNVGTTVSVTRKRQRGPDVVVGHVDDSTTRHRAKKIHQTGAMDRFVTVSATTTAAMDVLEDPSSAIYGPPILELPALAPIPEMDMSAYKYASANLSSSTALADRGKERRLEADVITLPPKLRVVTLPLSVNGFHRNRTALEHPPSAEVLQRLRRQSKGKKKRGMGGEAGGPNGKPTLTLTRFFKAVPRSLSSSVV